MKGLPEDTEEVSLPSAVVKKIASELNKDNQIIQRIQQLENTYQEEKKDSKSAIAIADEIADEKITYGRLAGASVEDGCVYVQQQEEPEVESANGRADDPPAEVERSA